MSVNTVLQNCHRVAILSDIHSNALALEACLADARREGADGFVFLGDYVSGLAEPEKTLELVYEIRSRYPTVCVRGNRERYMLSHQEGVADLKKDLQTGSYLYTYERLQERDLAFFADIPFYDVAEIGGVVFEIAHATKTMDRFYFWKDDPRIAQVFCQMTEAYLLTGHAHRQYVQTEDGKTILNPGSVGLPCSGDALAQYAVLCVENGCVSHRFRRVPYDYEALVRTQFCNGLVAYAKYWAISDLYQAITGKEYTKMLLDYVYAQDATEDDGVWREGVQKLGLYTAEEEILRFLKTI